MPYLRVEAPAKLNVHLRIGDKRQDGFHELESLFLALAFGDILHFETAPSSGLTLSMDRELPDGAPPEQNIISRAVSLFRSRTGYDKGLKIAVEKRIPLGGGLGGGSSDAAAALMALNRLASDEGCAANKADLAEMGASLGSDVPFFLHDTPLAWIRGRGERVQSLTLPESLRGLFFVLVNPGFPSDTAGAFRLVDEFRQNTAKHRHLRASSQEIESLIRCLSEPPGNWPFVNDFLPAFEAGAGNHPVFGKAWFSYQQILIQLRELGADFIGLSGSGSTCFGVFSNGDTARAAGESLDKCWPFAIITFLLAYRAIQYYNSGSSG
jgi:4-diphosphocytidyl-2-C-methyl-D-erythritol kinase